MSRREQGTEARDAEYGNAAMVRSTWQQQERTQMVIWGYVRLYFGGLQKSLQMVIVAMKLKDTPWKDSYDQTR